MGKSQKQRKMRRHNPMRVPDSHLPHGLASASESAPASKAEAILPIIQKMQSADAGERKWACVAVSNLIQNDPSTRRLLQGKNIVGALITRLSDSEEEVVVEAGGALRNLCIDGGYDICAEMYNKNILAPLKTFIPKISTTLSQYLENPKSAPENAQKLVYEFADNVITILWCLSETSNKALNAINQISLVPFLMSFLGSRDKLPIATVTSADDNPPAIDELRPNGAYTACLLAIARPEQHQDQDQVSDKAKEKAKAPGPEIAEDREVALRVLCSGILRNITPIPPPSIAATVDIDRDVVLPTLEPVLTSLALPEAAQRAQELITQSAEDAIPAMQKLSLKNTPKTDHRSPAELELERLERRLRTIQQALEILTGVCATLPDPEPEAADGEDEDGDNENEEQEDLDEDQDDEMDTEDLPISPSSPNTSSPLSLPPLVHPLLALAHPTALSFPPLAGGPAPHPPTTAALSAIHLCALECLNNVFLSLAFPPGQGDGAGAVEVIRKDTAAGTAIWGTLWEVLGAVGVEIGGAGQERRKEMWGVGVGVLWGVANVWKGVLAPQEEHVKVLMQLCDAADDDAVKVKCIGTLECLAQHPTSVDANRVITQYLISLLPTPITPSPLHTEPLLQALSALIDIFSDETLPTDANFRTGNYLAALVGAVEGVRRAVRGVDRKRERELRRRGEEVRDNLVAFVEYRRGLGV
ncbi:hypothetical protein EIP86_004679 [Pleurotus ostreatoroseus]|nr:hypothetical protein EIP86_004679 [Pleurotus ostreatoroseus]